LAVTKYKEASVNKSSICTRGVKRKIAVVSLHLSGDSVNPMIIILWY